MPNKIKLFLFLLIPNTSHAMILAGDLSGAIEFLLILFVLSPIITIEILVITILLILKKFKNYAVLKRTNVITFTTYTIRAIVLTSFVLSVKDTDSIPYVLAFIFSAIFTIFLPNAQHKSLNIESKQA